MSYSDDEDEDGDEPLNDADIEAAYASDTDSPTVPKKKLQSERIELLADPLDPGHALTFPAWVVHAPVA